MKTSTASRTLVVARIGLTIAAFALGSCSADDLTKEQEFARLARAAAQAGTTALPTDDPMAVFIDGPTGYTFAWTNDGGWKFVGHIADEKH